MFSFPVDTCLVSRRRNVRVTFKDTGEACTDLEKPGAKRGRFRKFAWILRPKFLILPTVFSLQVPARCLAVLGGGNLHITPHRFRIYFSIFVPKLQTILFSSKFQPTHTRLLYSIDSRVDINKEMTHNWTIGGLTCLFTGKIY